MHILPPTFEFWCFPSCMPSLLLYTLAWTVCSSGIAICDLYDPLFHHFYVIRKSWNKPVPAAWRAIIDITLIGVLKRKTIATEGGKIQYFLFDYSKVCSKYRIICNSVVAISTSHFLAEFHNQSYRWVQEWKCMLLWLSKNYNRLFTRSNCHNPMVWISIRLHQWSWDSWRSTHDKHNDSLWTNECTNMAQEKDIKIEEKPQKEVFESSVLSIRSCSFGCHNIAYHVSCNKYKSYCPTQLPKRNLLFDSTSSYFNLPTAHEHSAIHWPRQSRTWFLHSYMEDGHVSINDNYTEEQRTRTRAHTILWTQRDSIILACTYKHI